MYLDLEDHHPDTPRVERVISVREGILLSIIAHLILGILYLITPRSFFTYAPLTATPVQPHQTIQFVEVAPLIDRTAPPKRPADASDLDRRSATREKAPDPTNAQPFSRGNTPEEKVGGPTQQAAAPTTPEPPTPTPPAPKPPDLAARGLDTPAQTTPPRPAGAGLGQALRNLQQYLQNDNFENIHGGDADQSADIQFDSKGVDFGPWLRRFTDQVKRNWQWPEAAMALKGHVVIQFSVLKNGAIVDVHVVQPSTVGAFTQSAMNALTLSNPTAALPPEYPDDRAVITATFHYNEMYER